ncbi:hypothetical protein ACSTEA_23040, partial [Vibrio vulnificus]
RRILNAWQFQFRSASVLNVARFKVGWSRCSPLNAALCLITKSQWFMIALCSLLVFLGKLASVGAVFWTIILWRWKFSELPQSIFGQARG